MNQKQVTGVCRTIYQAHPVGKLLLIGIGWLIGWWWEASDEFVRTGFTGDVVYHYPQTEAGWQRFHTAMALHSAYGFLLGVIALLWLFPDARRLYRKFVVNRKRVGDA